MPFASNDGVRIRYETVGDGDPVLLIPGLGGGIQQLQRLAEILAASHHVIFVDPRGAGGSDKPDVPFSGSALADDMQAVLQQAGGGPAHVIGISFGGMIAQELALAHPGSVRSLLLASSYAAADAWSARMWSLREMLLDRVDMTEQFRMAMMFLFSPRVFRDDPESLQRLESAFAAAPPDPAGYRRQLQYCRDHDTRDRLKDVVAPTLVVTGAEDLCCTAFQGQDLAAAIPGARYREIPAAAHLFMLSRPDEFAALWRSFKSGELR